MGTLYLVRHGQASFGTDDYDRLSELGQRQAVRLGQHWAERGLRFDAAITGTLKRHAQTFEGIAEGAGMALQPLAWPGLNEYDAEAGTVIPRLQECHSSADVATVLHEEFERWFGEETAGPRDRYLELAAEIWACWTTRVSS